MRRYKVVIAALSVLLVLAGGFIAYTVWPRDTGLIPKAVAKELAFSPLVLTGEGTGVFASEFRVTNAEDGSKVLIYQINMPDNMITVSQYAQPPQFSEIPDYKDRFLTNVANQYTTVQTSNGTIYLGRMAKQDNKQLAVMVERGLLIFMNPQHDLEPAQWRSIGEQLELQKVIN
jgi:hypothetical protein